MPHFFFNTRSIGRPMPDDEGLAFASQAEAREAAARSLGELANDVMPHMQDGYMAVTVTDQEGQEVFTAAMMVQFIRPPNRA